MADWKDILSDDELPDANDSKSLEGTDVVRKQEESFEKDATEGLQAFQSKKNIDVYVAQLNKQLQKQTNGKRKRKIKRKIDSQRFTLLAVIIILAVCLLCFIVIKTYQKKHSTQPVNTAAVNTCIKFTMYIHQ